MLTFFILGLLWIVAYYIAPTAPVMSDLAYWNVVGGFVLIGCGFIVSTKWNRLTSRRSRSRLRHLTVAQVPAELTRE